jgi:hypothetical protein
MRNKMHAIHHFIATFGSSTSTAIRALLACSCFAALLLTGCGLTGVGVKGSYGPFSLEIDLMLADAARADALGQHATACQLRQQAAVLGATQDD